LPKKEDSLGSLRETELPNLHTTFDGEENLRITQKRRKLRRIFRREKPEKEDSRWKILFGHHALEQGRRSTAFNLEKKRLTRGRTCIETGVL